MPRFLRILVVASVVMLACDSPLEPPPQFGAVRVELVVAEGLEDALAAVDQGRIRYFGPDSNLSILVTPGSSTAVQLSPGSYRFVFQLLTDGAIVGHAESTGLVRSEDTLTVEMTLRDFVPTIPTPPADTTAFGFDFGFVRDAAAQADSFDVRWAGDPAFTAATTVRTTTPSAPIEVPGLGTYFVQARGVDEWGDLGAWSDSVSFDVVAEPTVTTPDFGTVVEGAPIRVSGVNIAPAGDLDEYVLGVCQADTLVVDLRTAGLAPPSPLAGRLELLDPGAALVAATDATIEGQADFQLAVPIAVHGDHTLRVHGVDNSQGHYEADLAVRPGDLRTADGMACRPLAASLVLTTQPTDVTAGDAIAPGIVIEARDDAGDVATEFNGEITATVTEGASIVSGASATATDGVATFDALRITTAGTFTLELSDESGTLNVTTDPFTVGAAAASQLAWTVAPGGVTAGVVIDPPPTIQVRDEYDNVAGEFTGTIAVAIGSFTATELPDDDPVVNALPCTAALTGTTSRDATAGVAVFDDISVNCSGTFSFEASAPGTTIPSETTADVTATPNVAVALGFEVEPSDVAVNATIVPPVEISAVDENGNVVAGLTGTVTVAIESGTGTAGAVLSGTTAVNFVDGIATFSDLAVDRVGGGYRLEATNNAGLTDATSAAFSVLGTGDPVALGVAADPPEDVVAGAPFSVTVTARDDQGEETVLYGGDVTVSITDGTGTPGATLGGTVTRTATDGTVTFDDLTVDLVGNAYTLEFTDQSGLGLTGVTSTEFDVANPPPTQLVITTQPVSGAAGDAITLVVEARDTNGTLTPGFAGDVDVVITQGTGAPGAALGGTTTRTLVGGVATFDDLVITAAASGYTLDVSTVGLTGATSDAFDIGPGAAATVTVTPSGAALAVGEAAAFSAVASDTHGNPIAAPATTWSTGNTAVAVTDQSGSATAQGVGQTAVAAEVDGVRGYATITATDPGLTPVNLWIPEASPTAQTLTALWGAEFNDVTGVGFAGEVVRFDAATWTVVQPAPLAEVLFGVWGAATDDIVAVGDGGKSAVFNGTDWVEAATSTTRVLRGVWGASPADAHAVGQGVVVRRSGGVWGTPNVGLTSNTLEGVWGTAADDVYAVGGAGDIVRFDGATWADVTSPVGTGLTALWGATPADVFAAGDGGALLRTNAGVWESMTSPTGEDLLGLGGSSVTELFAVGAAGTILRFDGADWTDVGSPTAEVLRDVWASPAADMFIVGDGGTILRGLRGATVVVTPPTPAPLTMLSGSVQLAAEARTAADVPVPGVPFTWSSDDEAVVTVDGTGLVSVAGEGSATITATAAGGVSGSVTVTVAIPVESVDVSPVGAFVEGFGASQQFTAVARDGNGDPIPNVTFNWTSTNPNVATVDAQGLAIGQRDGQMALAAEAGGQTGYGTLTVLETSTEPVNVWQQSALGRTLNGIWGAAPDDVWVVGSGGGGFFPLTALTVRYDGVSWNSVGNPLGENSLRGVWGTGPDDVWAVGENGTVGHFDGMSWSSIPNFTAEDLNDVWGSGPTDVYAIGQAGSLFHYDGTDWSLVDQMSNEALNGISGTAANDVWVVGNMDPPLTATKAFHFDGTTWDTVTTCCAVDLMDLMMVTPTSGLAAGRPFAMDFNGSWGSLGTIDTMSGIWTGGKNDGYFVGTPTDVPTITRVFEFPGFGIFTEDAEFVQMCCINALSDVWGTSTGDVWAVGFSSIALDVAGVLVQGHRGASVTITPNAPTLTAVGETVQLTAEVRDASGAVLPMGVPIAWTPICPACNVDSTVMLVDGNGLVTAFGSGTASVIATASGGAADTIVVTVDLPWSSVSTGANHTCAIDITNTAFCWGAGSSGQLGNGGIDRSTPRRVSGDHVFTAIAAGGAHTCAIDDAGDAWCWGAGIDGQLGDGGQAMSNIPVQVAGSPPSGWSEISAGGTHSCGVWPGNVYETYCWGLGTEGQVDGTTNSSPTPVLAGSGEVIESLTSGEAHNCHINVGVIGGGSFTRDGVCWGRSGDQQLEVGTLQYIDLAAGTSHSCGVTTANDAYCWGSNASGQLGTGAGQPATLPALVLGGLTYKDVAAGFTHTCAITQADALYCWGANDQGQLGDGTGVMATSPTAVTGLGTIAKVDVSRHSCAIDDTGAVYCWGPNGSGQLGDGTNTLRPVPVRVTH